MGRLFNDIPPHEPLLHASPSPIPRTNNGLLYSMNHPRHKYFFTLRKAPPHFHLKTSLPQVSSKLLVKEMIGNNCTQAKCAIRPRAMKKLGRVFLHLPWMGC